MSIKNFFSTYYAFGSASASGVILVFCLYMLRTSANGSSIAVALFMALLALAYTIPAGLLLAKQNIPENKLILRLAISAAFGALAGWLMITMFLEVLSNGKRSASNIGIYLICSVIAHLAVYITVKLRRNSKK